MSKITIVPLNILNVHMLDGGYTPAEIAHTETKVEKTKLSPEARNAMVLDHQRLIWKIARKNIRDFHDLSEEDLFQAGVIGAIEATKRFEPVRGNKFSTYATYWIRNSIREAVINEGRNIRVPEDAYTLYGQIYTLEGRAGRKLSTDELRKAIKDPKLNLEKLRRNANFTMRQISEGRRMSYGDPFPNLLDTIPNEKNPTPEEEAITNERTAIARAIMAELEKTDPKASKVLKMRFGFERGVEMDNAEIGGKFGVTREAIRVKGKKGLKQLRAIYQKMKNEAKGTGRQSHTQKQMSFEAM